MITANIIEYKIYSFSNLSQEFNCNEEKTKFFLKKLKKYGIVKPKEDLSNINNENIENVDIETENCYVFKYVGIIIISDLIIKCYPKYLKNNANPDDELKQVLKVIKKYNNSKGQNIQIQEELDKNSNFNMLSIMIYLIEDYYSNGLYRNSKRIIENNGPGEIIWDKTINENNALIQKNRPYYFDLYTKKTIDDEENYFKLLHEVILTKCSKELEDTGLLDLFELTPINLNNNEINNFGEEDFIKFKIKQELNIQFNSHKRLLLKTMYAYIENKGSYLGDINYFNLYGTNSYNLIWEEICGFVLKNKKNEKLKNLEMPNGKINKNYDKNQTLLSIIEKPSWHLLNKTSKSYEIFNSETLIPDILVLNKTEKGTEFIIFDAKYYNLPSNRPGIGDIIKQYLYELAYKEFIKLNGFIDSKNCFLFPTDGENIINKGYVELKMLNNLDLKNIEIILLPAKLINQLYLENKELNISKLNI